MGNPWNVAVFFVIAGFFLKIDQLNNTKDFILKKIKTLYVPATIIYLLAVLMHNVFVSIGWYPIGDKHSNGIPFDYYDIKDFLVGCTKVLCCGGSGEQVMGAMWFLYTLIYSFVGIALAWWLIGKVINRCSIDRGKLVLVMTFIIYGN